MKSLSRLIAFLKPYQGSITLSMVLLVCLVMTDLSIPRLIQTLIDTGIRQRDMNIILNISLIMLGLTLLSALLTVSSMLIAVRVSNKVAADIRRATFVQTQSFSFGNLDRLQTGQLLTRMTSDITQIGQLIFQTMRSFVRAPLMILGSLVLLAITNWQVALMMAVLMPAAIGVFFLYAAKAQPLFMQVQKKLSRLNTILQENLAGVRLIKAFVRADHESNRFGTANVNLMDQSIKVDRMLAFLLPTLRLLVNLGFVAVIWFGGIQVIDGSLTVGELVALNNYIFWALFPLINLGMMVGFISSADASAQRVFEVLDSQPEVQESPNAIAIPKMKGKVALEQVSFSYGNTRNEMVLENIDLRVNPGEKVAFVGATGSGKSTLINLIPRFYDVSQGKILIDEKDVKEITLDSLRKEIGVVLQESVLFSGSISENIRYGNSEATDEEVVSAAKTAQAHDFIMGFPDGYDTWIGQRGVNLSGGQKQRLAIARALLIDPSILILDDSTSSVDLETEAKLRDALNDFMKNRTTFMIAQRISSVMDADRIVVLDRGRIVGTGTHRELLDTNQIYREIYQSQMGIDGGFAQ
ncbi:MAG TPA: multidrug ABC transporter ATP-binding protein [Clostridiales bacterium]|nr:multidrug ABC transporter ATP-binding protein [Clostridiales bacterium]